MLPYILHVALLLGGFFVLYKFLLEKETFFALHRWLLLGSIVLAFGLPFLEIPQTWSVWQTESITEDSILGLLPSAIDGATSGEHIHVETTVENTNSPLVTETETESTPSIWASLNWMTVLFGIYWIGVAIFGINFLIQLGTLLQKIIRLPSLKDEGYRIVELNKDEPPYSFMNCVFINPEKYDWDTYNQIIEHEKIHIQQAHSVDMLLAELLVVFQWFNPAAWQYRTLIENNLEFLTDQSMLRQGAQPKEYQLNLLKVSVPQYPIGLAMNYNQSFLKKRISMMNVKKSSVRSSWKYLLLLPVLGLSIVCLNAVQANAQEESTTEQVPVEDSIVETETTAIPEREAAPTPTPAPEAKAKVKAKMGKTEKWKSGTIITGEGAKEQFLGNLSGRWYGEREGDELCFRMEDGDGMRNYGWSFTRCFLANEFTNSGTTKLVREAGTLDLNELMQGDEGMGKFTFTPNEDFKSYLSRQYGYSSLGDKYMFHLFIANINKDYLQFLKRQGYDEVSKSKLQELAIHGLDKPYLERQLATLKAKGIEKPSLRKLIELRIHGVSDEYIAEMGSVGFKDLSVQQLIEGRIHGVDPDYVKEIRSLGYTDLSFRDFVEFRIHGVHQEQAEALKKAGFSDLSAQKIKEAAIHGVNADYIEEMGSVGFTDLSLNDLVKGRIHGVRTDYVKEIRALGYTDLSFNDFVDFSIHGVRTEVVESLRKIGFRDLSASKIKSAAIHGVSASYIKGIREAGYDLKDIQDLIDFRIHGVSVDFIASLEEMGYNNVSAHDIKSAAIHGVRASFISDIRDLGFKNLTLDQAATLRIHGVSPEYIKRKQAKGFTDLDLDDYIQLKILGK